MKAAPLFESGNGTKSVETDSNLYTDIRLGELCSGSNYPVVPGHDPLCRSSSGISGKNLRTKISEEYSRRHGPDYHAQVRVT